MHFTVVLTSEETANLVAGITFEPVPVITVGEKRVIPHGAYPTFEHDDVLPML